LRKEVAAALVGDDDFAKFRWQLGGLGDDPDTRLGPLGAGDYTADVVWIDGHLFRNLTGRPACLLPSFRAANRCRRGNANRQQSRQ